MAQIIVVSESLERLQGFLIGIEWTNDSALSLDQGGRAAAQRAVVRSGRR